MRNKMISILLLVGVCFLAFGCSSDNNMIINKKKDNYYDLKKLDQYLYQINYSDYKYDKNHETITNLEDFGCSSVHNGNFYGRNFDFIFNDVPEFVVKVDAKDGRHSSIGVAILSAIHSNDDIEKDFKDKLLLIPNFTLDGINDAGVIVSDNVVPKNDTGIISGTNPDGEDLHMGFVVRFLLDNASSADDAIELLSKRNIYGDMGDHYNLHIMIADKDKTYVVEFIDNKMVAKEKNDNEQIMTNYYVNLDNYTENAAGIERYDILKENYNEGSSFEGMWNLLRRVQYSKAYLFDKDQEWYSEYFTQSNIKSMKENEENFNELYEQFKDFKINYWVARAYNQRNPANSACWITTHNSTYDINQRKLRVTIQENYDKYYEFSLE